MLTQGDKLGGVKVRWGIGRYDYRIEPGLYAVGEPDKGAPVLVTANYKLTFDSLRRELFGLDVFVLVLETMGINVWCAAGKGTFGTDELVQKIEGERLADVVYHRRVILPQLGAPGIKAHEIKLRTGFKVTYGPICATDIQAFLAASNKATNEMRRKRFPMAERAALIPMELVPALKIALPLALAALFLAGLGTQVPYLSSVASNGLVAMTAVLGATLAGSVLTPLLLPYLPGRAFSIKGAIVAVLFSLPPMIQVWRATGATNPPAWLELGSLGLLATAISSFLAMNFTGSSTYTSLSGVEKEMRVAVPLQLGVCLVGLAGLIIGRLAW